MPDLHMLPGVNLKGCRGSKNIKELYRKNCASTETLAATPLHCDILQWEHTTPCGAHHTVWSIQGSMTGAMLAFVTPGGGRTSST